MRARGMALGSVLMLVGTTMVIAFTVVAIVSFQMSTGIRQLGSHAARNAAESALTVAIARIGDSNGTFGSVGTEEVRVDGLDGEVGIVTFRHDQVESRPPKEIPLAWSTHNFVTLTPTTAKGGYNRTVPRDSVHLIASGITPSGLVSRVEAVIYFPPFTYAIASSGSISLTEVMIAGIPDPAHVARDANGVPSIDPATLGTGDVGGNATLDLTRSTVKGDAQAASTINIASSTVEGETRPNAGPLHLPTVNLADYDPGTQTVCRDLPDTFDESTLSGNARRDGDLTVTRDVRLDNGLLYVTGNLHLRGGLKGKGIVIVNGNTDATGSVDVESSDSCALLCNGSVTISGSAAFQGMVFCRGSFTASDITLIGTFIQNSASPAARMTLTRANVLYQNTTSHVEIFRPGSFLFKDSDPSNPVYSEAVPQYDGTTKVTQFNTSEPPPNLDALVRPDLQAQWGTSAFTQYCHDHALFTVSKRNGSIVYTLIMRGRMTEGDADYLPPNRDLLPGSPFATLPTSSYPGAALSIIEKTDLADLFAMLQGHQTWEELDSAQIDAWRQQIRAHLAQVTSTVPIAARQQVNFSFSPSRFLTATDQMRVLYQGDLP